MGLPTVILIIVSKHARLHVVIFLLLWTPNCLEVEHIEIGVMRESIEQVNGDFFFAVSEPTIFPKFANSFRSVVEAELSLEHIWMIKLLYCVVRVVAIVTIWAYFFLAHFRTQIAFVAT
jgi:hypothetical protein